MHPRVARHNHGNPALTAVQKRLHNQAGTQKLTQGTNQTRMERCFVEGKLRYNISTRAASLCAEQKRWQATHVIAAKIKACTGAEEDTSDWLSC